MRRTSRGHGTGHRGRLFRLGFGMVGSRISAFPALAIRGLTDREPVDRECVAREANAREAAAWTPAVRKMAVRALALRELAVAAILLLILTVPARAASTNPVPAPPPPATPSAPHFDAGLWDARIQAAVASHQATIIELRHHIHQHPELGNREFETAKLVADHLNALGLEVRTGIAHTGVVGVLRGGRPGPVVAVRADMDALPVTEQTGFLFRSNVHALYDGHDVGVMHACGHDLHTAIELGVASVLADMRAELAGTVMFIFQPAEEGAPPGEEGGAALMMAEKIFADPTPVAIFGLHTRPELPVGTVGYSIGAALAASDVFKVTLKGIQAHGASPQQGIDPIVMAAEAILALQTIPSRSVDPLQPCVLTVGKIQAGERFNIIPAEAILEGTVRTYDAAVRDQIERRMHEILDGISRANGGSYDLEYSKGYDATINDPALSHQAVQTLQAVLGPDRTLELPPVMWAEDFSQYAMQVPGFFFFLGTLKEGTESGPLHSPTMRADDSAVPVGMRAMANLVVDRLLRGP
jgi:amidohydrolase